MRETLILDALEIFSKIDHDKWISADLDSIECMTEEEVFTRFGPESKSDCDKFYKMKFDDSIKYLLASSSLSSSLVRPNQ